MRSSSAASAAASTSKFELFSGPAQSNPVQSISIFPPLPPTLRISRPVHKNEQFLVRFARKSDSGSSNCEIAKRSCLRHEFILDQGRCEIADGRSALRELLRQGLHAHGQAGPAHSSQCGCERHGGRSCLGCRARRILFVRISLRSNCDIVTLCHRGVAELPGLSSHSRNEEDEVSHSKRSEWNHQTRQVLS